MSHIHDILDSDVRFAINPVSREITNESGKSLLMQNDHNSERFTFEVPRFIDGHDMSLCTKVCVHYINLHTFTKEQSKDVYPVTDMQVSPADDNVVIFSWLISGNATKYEGILSFLISFECLTGETVDYAWHTGIYNKITVGEGMDNGEAVIATYSDVLEAWRQSVMAEIEAAKQAAVAVAMNLGAVVYEPQELTEAQKAQARANIEAEAAGRVTLKASDITWVNGTLYENTFEASINKIASGWIRVGRNRNVTITSPAAFPFVCLSYDENKSYLSTTGWVWDGHETITLADEACYIRLVVRNAVYDNEITPDTDTDLVISVGRIFSNLEGGEASDDTRPEMVKMYTLPCRDYVAIDTVNNTITFPELTEFIATGIRKIISEPLTLTISDTSNTSTSVVFYRKATDTFEVITGTQIAAFNTTGCYYICSVRDKASNFYYKPTTDIGTPYYVDGELYGGTTPEALQKIYIAAGNDFISIDTANNTITIPAKTELLTTGFRKILDEDVVLSMSALPMDSSLSVVIYEKATHTFKVLHGDQIKTSNTQGWYYLFCARDSGSTIKVATDIGTPYYIDGVLYGGANTSNSGTLPDATKVKEFAGLFNGTDKVEPFMFFTDPHLCGRDGNAWREEFDTYMNTLRKFYNESAVSRVFCGGDWLGGTITAASDACYRLGLIDAKMREYFAEYHNMRGNHDSNFAYSDNPLLDGDTIRNLMFRKEGATYYSVEGENTKFFVFDTQNEDASYSDSGLEAAQIKWFADALKSNTTANIALMLHMVRNPYNSETLHTLTSALLNIAQAFNNKTSITVQGSAYDFAGTTGKVRFLMGGHSHLDATTTSNGIPIVLTTQLRDGGTPTFDLCLANYDTNTLHLVRVGTGASRTVALAV